LNEGDTSTTEFGISTITQLTAAQINKLSNPWSAQCRGDDDDDDDEGAAMRTKTQTSRCSQDDGGATGNVS